MIQNFQFKPGQAAEFVTAREGYDRWAEIYDAEDNPLIAVEERVIPGLIGDVAGRDVLDLGCGTGRQSLRFAAAGARVTAVDFSDGMIARAAGKPGWERIRFLAHDLTLPLPLERASYDLVTNFLVAEHVPELAAFFRECRRVCRGGGRVITTAMHPAMLLRGIHAHFRDPATGGDVCPASTPHEVSDFVMAVIRAGLEITHISEHPVDDALADRSPRAAKYRGWPILLVILAQPKAS